MNAKTTLQNLTVFLCCSLALSSGAFAARSQREVDRVMSAAPQPFLRAIAQKMSNAKDYLKRAKTKDETGDLQGAIADYSEAIKLKPDDANAYFKRGSARLVLVDLPGAIADFTQTLKLTPDRADAYNHRGVANQQLGKKQEAIADYQKAVELYQKQGQNSNAQRALGAIDKLKR